MPLTGSLRLRLTSWNTNLKSNKQLDSEYDIKITCCNDVNYQGYWIRKLKRCCK